MDVINEIKSRLPIRTLAEKYLGLTVNRNGKVPSPAHEDKDPSVQLYEKPDPRDDRFTDFSNNNKSGDVIDFYGYYQNIPDNKAAIKDLCNILGISGNDFTFDKREPEETKVHNKKFIYCFDEALLDSMTGAEQEKFWQLTRNYFSYSHMDTVEVTPKFTKKLKYVIELNLVEIRKIRLKKNREIFEELIHYCRNNGPDVEMFNYLVHERKLNWRILERLQFVYIFDYYKINNHLRKKYDLEDLQKSGLYNDNGNLRFNKHRIIIPHLYNNRPVYLRGRYFDENCNPKPQNGEGKYKGLANDEINVNKTKRFYNIDVINSMRKGERLYICEGELDAVALETLGRNGLGIPGAGNIPLKAAFEKLLNYEIVLIGHDDGAGQKMIDRLSSIFIGLKKPVIIKELKGTDINDFIKE